MRPCAHRWTVACGLSLLLAAPAVLRGEDAAASAKIPETVDYQSDIRPILAGRCYKCHGPLIQRGSLRLDAANLASMGGDSGRPILATAKESELARRLREADVHKRMPLGGAPLTESEIRLIERWLDPSDVPSRPPAPAQPEG